MSALVDRRIDAAGAWLRLVLNDPPANVLTMRMVEELRGAVADAASMPALKLVTLEGAGEHFSYGASVPEHLPPTVHRMLPAFHGLIADLLTVPAATAAIVRGRCLGGGFELALACDFVIAAAGARLGLPEVALGVFPPAGSALLPARIGAARAARVVITGETLPVSWWTDAGLVTYSPAADAPIDDVRRWFDKHLAAKSSVAIRHAALASREALGPALATLRALERQYLEGLLATHDGIEGCQAFVDRRPPAWADR
jgi:cyclohexa-1,5-dienecarbonyl-CoA hydratase